MAVQVVYRALVVFALFSTFVECQILSSPSNQIVCADENVDLDWVYGDAANFLTVTWLYINSQTLVETPIMQQTTGGSATIVGNYNVVHKTNGGITLTGVTEANSGSYKISVTYTSTSPDQDTVAVTVKDCSNCKCECDCECRTIVIVSILFGILGALGLLIIVVGIPTGWFNERKTLLLASGVIGIVSDVLSLVLSIVVKVKECCKCCEENCEDSECCKDWIDIAATAFIVIPCVAIVVSVVILILVKLDIIGPGNNAYKAKEAKEPGENHGMTGTSM